MGVQEESCSEQWGWGGALVSRSFRALLGQPITPGVQPLATPSMEIGVRGSPGTTQQQVPLKGFQPD